MRPDILRYGLAALFLLVAVVTDYREYKIKNKHVLLFSAAGLLLRILTDGPAGLPGALGGMLLPLLLFPLFLLEMLGAGDIKALCTVGSILGFPAGLRVMLFSFLAGGVIALGFMIFRKNAAVRARAFGSYVKQCFLFCKLLPYGHFAGEGSGFRFSLGILGGFAAALVFRQI